MADDFPRHPIKQDERIVFFTTDARLSDDGATWHVPIHAWVHELARASIRRKSVAAILKKKYGLETDEITKPNFDQRIRLLAADNERSKEIVISLCGNNYLLNKTKENGHSITQLDIDAAIVEQCQQMGQLRFQAVLPEGDGRELTGNVNLVRSQGVGVISDFDDTVKVTHVTDRSKMLDQSLYQHFSEVKGMSTWYQQLASQGASFHIVSSSPWQLYEAIDQFLDSHQFPPRSLSLKYFRFKDSSLLNIFKPGVETKPAQIKPILESYPAKQFVLIGDSGEQDPEVYGEIYRRYRDRIQKIYIRNITNAERSDSRFVEAFKDIDDEVWQLFAMPSAK